VAIPTYQRDDYLKAALESVLAQTITNLEIIVSDNANSAATRALTDSYRDSRVTYAPLERNVGLHRNLTRCLHLGSAPFVALLLDDDTMYPTNIETKLGLLAEYPSAGVAHGAFDYIDEAGRVTTRGVSWTGGPQRTSRFETGREFIQRTMETGNRIAASSAVIRRSAATGLFHDRRDDGFSELGLWLRIAVDADFAFCDDALTTVRLHARSVSSQIGLHESGEGEVSLFTFPMTRASRSAKLRFIEESEIDPQERAFLRGLVKGQARSELKDIVGPRALDAPDPGRTARQLLLATQIEPSLLWSPWAFVILASSVFGRRVYDTVVDLRSKL